MHILFQEQMKCKISWQDRRSSPLSTYSVGTGNCQYTQQTMIRLPLAQDLVWGILSFAKCLSGAPASFQWLMDKICRGLPFTITYLDNGLVHFASMQEHAEHLRLVLVSVSPQLASHFEAGSATLAWLRSPILAMCSQQLARIQVLRKWLQYTTGPH